MNQEYLQGLSSDMDSPEDAVFFKATPHNIAAFLAAHRWADMSAIGTVDEKTFLTARMGLIDICPDQEYLASKIIPAYAPCLMDPDKTMELETVPKEVAQSAPCPQPDWNYLRWDGYSDEKYQAIQSGDGLLKLPWDGKTISLDCQVRSYYNNGNLALLLQDWNNGEPEPWGDLTVNLGISLDQDCAFVDVNNLGQEILPWLENEGLAKPTGRTQQSGFVSYPEYRFNREKLAKLDPEGYQSYVSLRDSFHNQSPGMSMI